MCGERHKLAGDKAVATYVPACVERRSVEQRGQVEGCESIEHNDFVGGVGVNGLIEGEVRRIVVKRLVEGGERSRITLRKPSNPLLEETLALRSRDGRTWTVVVVEGLESQTPI